MIVVEGFPTQFGAAPCRKPRSDDNTEHACHTEIRKVRYVQQACVKRLADCGDESQALRLNGRREIVAEQCGRYPSGNDADAEHDAGGQQTWRTPQPPIAKGKDAKRQTHNRSDPDADIAAQRM